MRHLVIAVALGLAWAAGASAAQVTLNWTDLSTNELGFYVERKAEVCTGTSTAWVRVGEAAVNATTYLDTAVQEAGTYCYRVQAWNTPDGTPGGTKQYSGWSNLAGMTVPFAVPAAPGQLGVVAGP